ncbi:hypothetical protein BYT27DRAFT_7091051 [Phlegmacium glaucopus]|nr:hypothetical protein BYT27DRAFT_7091051 [Phlegmacium glaucopus]
MANRIGFDWGNFSPRTLNFFAVHLDTGIRDTGDISAKRAVDATVLVELEQHLQAAVSLELKTIPLYLYAVYSIKKPGPASWSIMSVVKQEMLHLALAGNILCSIGGDAILYKKKTEKHFFVPEYPDEMLYRDFTLNLDSANKRTLRAFMEACTIKEFELYPSIGAFYQAISLGIQFPKLLKRWDTVYDNGLFLPETTNRQFSYEDSSWYDKSMIIIKDIDSAQAAIRTIVDQGEGSTMSPHPKLPNSGRVLEPAPPVAIKSHFEVFEDLYNGPKLDHHNFIENPKTSDLAEKQDGTPAHEAHPVLVACDAVYCYLLISIEKVWDPSIGATKRSELVTINMRNIMLNVLRPLATFLTKQQYKKGEITYQLAPFFNLYEFGNSESCHKQLLDQMKMVAVKFPELVGVKDVVAKLVAVDYRGWPTALS